MAQLPPSQKRKSISKPVAESGASLASSRKHASTASTAIASEQLTSSKRIKTEKTCPTEPELTMPMGKLSDPIYDTIVEIKIGEELTSFGIHRGLLRRASSFFRDQLSTSVTTEGGIVAQSVVLMKDEDPGIFRRFNTWLYSDKIISASEAYKSLPWEVIFEVYSFAERIGIPRLQNKCIDTVIMKRRKRGLFPAQGAIDMLWKCTGNVFRLRKLLLDLFASECNLTNAIANNGSYHRTFLQGLVLNLHEMKKKRTVYDQIDFWKKRQKYYVDDSENPILLD